VSRPSFEPVTLPDADIGLHKRVFEDPGHDRLFRTLRDEVEWCQHELTVYGRRLPAPRLSAWYGEPGAVYTYSGITLTPLSWHPALSEIKSVVEKISGISFNSALLNLYRDGRDSVGWHSDAEKALGPEPVIASVSLGALRRFELQHRKLKGERVNLDLEPGSVLLMKGPTQRYWRHQLPKTREPVGERINITFRVIVDALHDR
jgi:alkylated DNA repair dioxygenase AlkB